MEARKPEPASPRSGLGMASSPTRKLGLPLQLYLLLLIWIERRNAFKLVPWMMLRFRNSKPNWGSQDGSPTGTVLHSDQILQYNKYLPMSVELIITVVER